MAAILENPYCWLCKARYARPDQDICSVCGTHADAYPRLTRSYIHIKQLEKDMNDQKTTEREARQAAETVRPIFNNWVGEMGENIQKMINYLTTVQKTGKETQTYVQTLTDAAIELHNAHDCIQATNGELTYCDACTRILELVSQQETTTSPANPGTPKHSVIEYTPESEKRLLDRIATLEIERDQLKDQLKKEKLKHYTIALEWLCEPENFQLMATDYPDTIHELQMMFHYAGHKFSYQDGGK